MSCRYRGARSDSGGARTSASSVESLPDGRHAFAAPLAKSNEQPKGPIHVPSREGPSMYSGLLDSPEAPQYISTAAPYLGDGTPWDDGSAPLSVLLTQESEISSTLLTELGRPGATRLSSPKSSPHQYASTNEQELMPSESS
jgi:hypothetical protein